ncbi:hypothetical protein NQZ68_037720 [Dissostichus eleginoides]|nr:hypothetical protein NQZ68_037720 [Dissostichus eleginoides]
MELYKFREGFPQYVKQRWQLTDAGNRLDVEQRSCQSPLVFMTGNLISRRVEVFRVSDSLKLREKNPSLEHKPNSPASFILDPDSNRWIDVLIVKTI